MCKAPTQLLCTPLWGYLLTTDAEGHCKTGLQAWEGGSSAVWTPTCNVDSSSHGLQLVPMICGSCTFWVCGLSLMVAWVACAAGSRRSAVLPSRCRVVLCVVVWLVLQVPSILACAAAAQLRYMPAHSQLGCAGHETYVCAPAGNMQVCGLHVDSNTLPNVSLLYKSACLGAMVSHFCNACLLPSIGASALVLFWRTYVTLLVDLVPIASWVAHTWGTTVDGIVSLVLFSRTRFVVSRACVHAQTHAGTDKLVCA